MTLSSQITTNSKIMEDAPDDDSWKTWFQLYGPKLLLCARQWTSSAADAEDVVQEAFIRFWRNQRQLPGSPMALLVTSVRRAALDLARRESRRAAREDRADGGLDARESLFVRLAEGDDRREMVEAGLNRLPDEQRDVLVLKIWGELTFDEIAAQLEIPANTASSRYRYALVALRRELISADCHG